MKTSRINIFDRTIRNFLRVVLFFLLIMAVGLIACESPAGDVGPQGPEGPIGPAGDDGSMMYAGAGEPTDDIGNIGDYYLNQDTGELHGPKDSDGWGKPIIVLMGDNGQDGTQIHSGDGVPDDTLGVIGDFYIDSANQDLYGPKTDSGWGDSVDLNGDDGQDGEDGADGENGEDGSQIYAGDGAPDASVGVVGDYYLDQTNKDLYGPKTDSGWGSPINLSGEDGQDGTNGSKIHSGSGAPDASIGVIGDYYLDQDNYDLYGPKVQVNKVNNGGWGSSLNLKGADGNANVTRYLFPGHDFSVNDNIQLDINNVTTEEMEQSAVLVYVKVYLGTKFNLPGYGTQAQTYYRTYQIGQSITIAIVEGPGEDYTEIEVVRIEANSTEDMTKQKGSIIPSHLNISDYDAVAEYYGLN